MKTAFQLAGSARKPERGSGHRLFVVLFSAFLLQQSAFIHRANAAKIYPSAGGTSAAFLKLGVGARAVAMGGAFAGVADDPYAIYWNPAGLAALDGEKNAGLFHNSYFQGLGQDFLFYTAPAAGIRVPYAGTFRSGFLGLGLNYFYTPKDMERRSGLYENDPLAPISPVEGKFGAYDLAFSAGYGWKLRRDVSLGGALKVIRQSIDDRSGSSLALDLGLLRELKWKGDAYTAGFSMQNLGPGIKFISRSYALPLTFKAGLSRHFPGSGLLGALTIDKPIDNYPSLALGAEYQLTGRLALRGGYRYRLYGNELGPWSGFSAGAGVAFEKLSFDYAFTPFGDLGNSHRFSLNFRFGEPPRVEKLSPAAPAVVMGGAKNFVFTSAPRALGLSRRGIQYEIKSVSADCRLYGITYRTLVRAAVSPEFSVAEGALPEDLLKGFPSGLVPYKAWQLPSLPGKLQGGIAFEFKVPKTAPGAGAPEFLFRSGDGWLSAPVIAAGEDQEFYLFSAQAPLSAYYAVAIK